MTYGLAMVNLPPPPPDTALTLLAEVPATTRADDLYWTARCSRIPDYALFVRLVMGTVVDYFKPLENASWCKMLTSPDQHQWSASGLADTWVVPEFVLDGDKSGGSAQFLPKTHFLAISTTGSIFPFGVPNLSQAGAVPRLLLWRPWDGVSRLRSPSEARFRISWVWLMTSLAKTSSLQLF
jgi:hypothetical protein